MEPEAFKTPIKPASAIKRKIALQLSSPSPSKIPRYWQWQTPIFLCYPDPEFFCLSVDPDLGSYVTKRYILAFLLVYSLFCLVLESDLEYVIRNHNTGTLDTPLPVP
jgi:hypothetical protein